MQKNFRIFYSWQSDLPDNTKLIRAALKSAASSLNKKYSLVHVVLDEATRGTPGSPNIPTTILEKIRQADVFIADVSIIRPGDRDNNLRACPNPNVTFELGYAVSQIGWPRIILLLNEHFGTIQDLPFDFNQHRVSPYKMDPTLDNSRQNSAAAKLAKDCKNWIEVILLAQPAKPTELVPDPAAIQHKRDVATLKSLLKFVNFDVTDEMMTLMPSHFDNKANIFWELFNADWSAPGMVIYDTSLKDTLASVHSAWGFLVSQGVHYHAIRSSTHRFAWTAQHPLPTPEQALAREGIEAAIPKLRESLEKLAELIRRKYLEIDLVEEKRTSWAWYKSEVAALDDSLPEISAGDDD